MNIYEGEEGNEYIGGAEQGKSTGMRECAA